MRSPLLLFGAWAVNLVVLLLSKSITNPMSQDKSSLLQCCASTDWRMPTSNSRKRQKLISFDGFLFCFRLCRRQDFFRLFCRINNRKNDKTQMRRLLMCDVFLRTADFLRFFMLFSFVFPSRFSDLLFLMNCKSNLIEWKLLISFRAAT